MNRGKQANRQLYTYQDLPNLPIDKQLDYGGGVCLIIGCRREEDRELTVSQLWTSSRKMGRTSLVAGKAVA